ncbi:mechanosensitive ion channel family protein [Geothrix sp. PMB-07]|uniref:mechanosensitive ion channel family protein n=1 Tax=Geothrix sp. PMB-07 TaxID=3068640 RepID=UPI0027419E86|nr:mechanosensitive ion channel domain-containing protein [Geothrix sp. PMB-07]WLT32894.1 mechanosensitive ion channel [Geothrix sp. PMB-07]
MTPTPVIRAWALLPEGAPLLHRLLVLALILLVGGFLLDRLRRSGKGLQARLQGEWKAHLPALRLGSLEVLPAERLGALLHRIAGLFLALVSLILAYILLSLAFGLFTATQGMAGRLLLSLNEPLGRFAWALLDYLPRGLVLVLIVLGTRMLLGLLKPLFETLGRGETRAEGFDAEWAKPTYTLVRLGVLAFALVLAVPYLPGSGSEAFKAVSLFVGVLVSLGSSGTIGNFISGGVLTYMRAYRTGDVVKLGEHTGTVVEHTLVITRLLTFKQEEIVLSNAAVLSGPIQNYSARIGSGGPLLHTTVSIGYGTSWRQVHELLLEAARRADLVEKTPAPFVLQTALNDFYITYELNAATRHPERLPWLYSELHKHIQDTFAEAGVEILSPHYAQLRDGHDAALPPGHGAHAPVTGFRIHSKES